MKNKFIVAIIFAFLLLFLNTSLGQGHHYTYLAEDPTKQLPPNETPFTDNYITDTWWWNLSMSWSADPYVLADAQVAINNWKNAVPQLRYDANPIDETSANLRFKYQASPTPGAWVGCYAVALPTNDRIWERASYIRAAGIFMDPSYNWDGAGATARRGFLAHELGHAYGLAHRYDESTQQCNNNETTIMDGFVLSIDMPFQCDGLTGPAPIDTQRVVDYWSKGEASDFKMAIVDRLVVGMWKDLAWTEDSYAVGFYWLDESTQPPTWILYDSRGMHDDIGVHKFTENRTLAAASDPVAFGAPIPSWQKVCNKPYFPPFNQFGIYRCSPVLLLQ